MRGFQKDITLGGRVFRSIHIAELQKWVAKNCKIFASELGSKLGVMRGFQKGIKLGGRPSRSA